MASRLFSPYRLAFVLLLLTATGEAACVAWLVGQQRTDATVTNLGGPQRMRTQRIAFLTERAVDPGLIEAERTELDRAIATFRATQRTLDDDPATRVGTLGTDGRTDLERAVDRYAKAAAEVLAHPKNATAANAYVLEERVPLLVALDTAVESHKAANAARMRFQWGALTLLFVLMGSLIAAAWRFIVAPLERLQKQSREQLRSLFEDNPEAVVTYGLDGRVVDANAAALELAGSPPIGLRGTTFVQSIAKELQSDAFLAFARGASGDPAKIETTIVRCDGKRIEVSASLLPSIVDGQIDGVYSIARNVTQERMAQRELVEQANRIRELYLVAATAGQSTEAQIVRALELGCARIGLEWGFVANVDHSVATLRASVGNGLYGTGDRIHIEKGLVRRALETNDLVVIDDPNADPVAANPEQRSGKLSTFVTFPIEVDSRPIAALGFASTNPDTKPLTSSDRDFVRLIGALIGAAIERGETRARLDAMAFSDALTGLPNRASLDASVEDLIGRARRSDDRFAVHFLDLDGFKTINDDHGHAAGDELLQVVAKRIARSIGTNDVAARLGGDEFIILAPAITGSQDSDALASAVIAAINEPIIIDGVRISIGASIGIATFPEDGTDVKTLFANADRALYRAKSSGRGCFESATSRVAS